MSSTASRRRLTGDGVALIIVGSIVALLALGMLASAVGAVRWADHERDADGYFTTSAQRYSSGAYAITHHGIDVDGLPNGVDVDDEVARVRITADSTNAHPVFVGIARERDVETYLANVPHSELTDFEVDPFRPAYESVAGTSRPARPGAQGIWVASASGSGSQTLTWRVQDGSWAVVAMNADGARGVEADVAVGAKIRYIGWIFVGIFAVGAFLAALATTLIVLGARRREPIAPSAPAAAVN
jgi:hypothetical protein